MSVEETPWICAVCGYENKAEATICAVCGTPKEAAPASAFGENEEGAGVGADLGEEGPGEEAQPADELPEWLSALKPETEGTSQEAGPQLSAGEPSKPEEPEEQPPAGAGEEVQRAEELPEWLSDFEPETAEETGDFAEEEAASPVPLTPEELPEWLRDLQPADAWSSEEQAHPEPGAGEPAQPAEESAAMLPKVTWYLPYHRFDRPDVPPQATPEEAVQAGGMEATLRQPAQPLPARPARRRFPVLSVVLGVAFLVVLALPLIFHWPAPFQPSTYPREAVSFAGTVNALAPGQAVLVGIDYEPALSAELNNLGISVIIQLLRQKNERLALVATTPAGAALGGALIEAVAAEPDGAQLSGRIANLGYVGSGPLALKAFAGDPRGTTAAGGTPAAWDSPALQGVKSLTDFGALLVISGDGESGRAWIEQVHPQAPQVPLLFVVPDQLGPMFQPYYASGQVGGILAGTSGGLAYNLMEGAQSPLVRYASAYQIGIIFVLAVLLLGAVITAVRAFTRKPGS
jgi:hypothetical protein